MCRYDRVKDSSDFGQARLGQFRSRALVEKNWELLVVETMEFAGARVQGAATSIIFRVPSET